MMLTDFTSLLKIQREIIEYKSGNNMFLFNTLGKFSCLVLVFFITWSLQIYNILNIHENNLSMHITVRLKTVTGR